MREDSSDTRKDGYSPKEKRRVFRSRSRDRHSQRNQGRKSRREPESYSESDYSYSYSYSGSEYSSRENSPARSTINRVGWEVDEKAPFRRRQTTELPKIDKNAKPIRERLPLPDLGMMRRMMTSIHKSNKIADSKEKSASQKKLEVWLLIHDDT